MPARHPSTASCASDSPQPTPARSRTSPRSMPRGAARMRVRCPARTPRRHTGGCTTARAARSLRPASSGCSLHRHLHRDLVAGAGAAAPAAALVVVMSVAVVIAALIVAVSMVLMVTMPVLLAALGTIAGLVLRGSHEIHRPVAGVVLVAVLTPVLGMARRHVQIERLQRHRLGHHHRHRDDRLRVHQRRWRPVTQHYPAIHTGNDLTGDRRIDTHILRTRQGHDRHQGESRLQYERDRSHKYSSGRLTVRPHGAHYAKGW